MRRLRGWVGETIGLAIWADWFADGLGTGWADRLGRVRGRTISMGRYFGWTGWLGERVGWTVGLTLNLHPGWVDTLVGQLGGQVGWVVQVGLKHLSI